MAGDPSRILVISLRRIGDLLLTTPLIRSLRRAWPNSEIDVLVFANTAGIVAGQSGHQSRHSHAAATDTRAERSTLHASLAAIRHRSVHTER